MDFEIILCDHNADVTDAFRRAFHHPLVSIEYGNFLEIAADAYVSPANCHGIMDGGFDRILRSRFQGIEARVQSEIDAFGGMLPVGKSVIVETCDEETPYLICTPTMIYPGDISGTRNVYLAMLGLLREVHKFNEINEGAIRSIAIPGLGTGVGRMFPEAAASQMVGAFDEFLAKRS